MLQVMFGAAIDGARGIEPELWRRYLEIVVQGLRADPSPPEPLEVAPVAPEQVDAVMAAAKTHRR